MALKEEGYVNQECTKEKLLKIFFDCFNDNSCVRVETFFEKLQEKSNTISLEKKLDDFERFKTFLADKNGQLEVLAEGYRCLSQIYINLLRDFEIFKAYPIRKYSSAFNYISKIEGFKDILGRIGYNEVDLKFELNDKKFTNDKETKIRAFNLLVCFMELMEMIALNLAIYKIPEIIVFRENNIKKKQHDTFLGRLTDEQILNRFEKCELCEGDMGDNGSCNICQNSVTDFADASRFQKLLTRRFKIDPSLFKVPDEKPTIVDTVDTVEKSIPRKPVKPTGGNKWACGACTFLNDQSNLNCEACGTEK